MQKYHLEFILHTYESSAESIKNGLREFAEDLAVTECEKSSGRGEDFQITLRAEDPTVIFDICAQFGRIRSAKIDEERGA